MEGRIENLIALVVWILMKIEAKASFQIILETSVNELENIKSSGNLWHCLIKTSWVASIVHAVHTVVY